MTMIQDILLTSPDFCKTVTNIGDNLNEKVMMTAIRETQDIELKQVIGNTMLKKLKQLVNDDEIHLPENEAYLDLLNECQYFIAYCVISKLCIITSYKLDNIGVVQTTDENIINPSLDDIYNIQNFYERKADYFRSQLQSYILNHLGILPEITQNQCNEIKAELFSAANSNLFLGGARGKGYWRCYPRYRYKYN